ncbi:MAG: addiction module protein [Planctomycetes bacterium]|nr:addiction module protein [Planctomycetota bacterium]
MPDHEDPLRSAKRLPRRSRLCLAEAQRNGCAAGTAADREAAWDHEIQRRLDEIDQGRIRLVPWTKARRSIVG